MSFAKNVGQVTPLLPPDLAFLTEFVQDNEPASITSSATVVLSPAQIKRLINWGRQTVDGRSLLHYVSLEDQFYQEELAAQPAVEMLASDEGLQEDRVERDCTEDNANDAYTG